MAITKPLIDRLPTVGELAPGCILPSDGNSATYETGGWRTSRPTYDPGICTNCLICWISCPDSAIIVDNGKMQGIDVLHCKGCGICAKECPTKPEKALIMQPGGVYQGREMFDRRG